MKVMQYGLLVVVLFWLGYFFVGVPIWIPITASVLLLALGIAFVLIGINELKDKNKCLMTDEIVKHKETTNITERPKETFLFAFEPNSKNLTHGKPYLVLKTEGNRVLVCNDKNRIDWYSVNANFSVDSKRDGQK